MRSIPVDERSYGWDEPATTFVVLIFSLDPLGGIVRTYELSECVLATAARWAQESVRRDEGYSIGLVDRSRTQPGIRWLLGYDPNSEISNDILRDLSEWSRAQTRIRF